MKEAKLGLRFGRGFCCESEALELACEHGIVLKEANGYLIEGEFFGNEHAAELYLAENEVVFDKMVSRIRTMLFNTEEIVGQYSCSTIHDVTRLKKPSFTLRQMKVQESGKQHNPQNVAVANRLSQEAGSVQHRVMPEERWQGSMDRHFADHQDEPGAANKQPRAPAGQFPQNASSEVSELRFQPEENLSFNKIIPFIDGDQLQRKEDEISSKNKKRTISKQKKTKGETKLQGRQKLPSPNHIPLVLPEKNQFRIFAICVVYYSVLLWFFIFSMI